ncbi:MAG: S-layer homology domain-containing protein [Limnochordales bacterium]|nr:S-layer homology domain-containing protein [Limnochordales bacterium]
MNRFLRYFHTGRTGRRVAIMVALALVLAASPIGAVTRPKDMDEIEKSFAAKDIMQMVQKGIATGYSDGTWRPNQPIRRSEFASMLSRALSLPSPGSATRPELKDIRGNWAARHIERVVAAGLMTAPDGRFRPDDVLTRSEIVTAIARALRIYQGDETWVNQWHSPFTDFSNGSANQQDRDFRAAEMVRRLGIMPQTFAGTFEPEREVTRQEAAALVNAALRTRTDTGTVAAVDPANLSLTLTVDGTAGGTGGEAKQVPVSTEATILRNGVEVSLDQLQAGDEVRVVYNVLGEAAAIRAKGLVTRQDLVSRLSALSRGILSPAEIETLLSGSKSQRVQAIWNAAYDALLRQGLSPVEADALLNQDWSTVRGLAAERLASALSESLGVSPDLVRALIARDREKVLEEARLEALSRLLTGQLNGLLSQYSFLPRDLFGSESER